MRNREIRGHPTTIQTLLHRLYAGYRVGQKTHVQEQGVILGIESEYLHWVGLDENGAELRLGSFMIGKRGWATLRQGVWHLLFHGWVLVLQGWMVEPGGRT